MSFSVGDTVTPVRKITFLDGTCHQQGKEYTVKPGHISYYTVNASDYKLVKSANDYEKEGSRVETVIEVPSCSLNTKVNKTKFSIGDTVTAVRTICIDDDTVHYKGRKYLVQKADVFYYNLNHSDYILFKSVEDKKNPTKICSNCQGWGCIECCTSEQRMRSMQGTFS